MLQARSQCTSDPGDEEIGRAECSHCGRPSTGSFRCFNSAKSPRAQACKMFLEVTRQCSLAEVLCVFLCANKGWTTNPKTSQNIRIADELWCCGICGFSNELNIRLFDWLPDATTNFCMICMSRTFLALLVKHLGKLGTCCSSPFPGPFFWYPKI